MATDHSTSFVQTVLIAAVMVTGMMSLGRFFGALIDRKAGWVGSALLSALLAAVIVSVGVFLIKALD